jgi:uncharacterized protein
MDPRRYLLDPLYGVIRPAPSIWELMAAPELQRLREVRMSNVNSLTLTGSGGITRFEHSVGTAHLGALCALAMDLAPDEARLFEMACLLHDVGSAGFGHSLQYVLSSKGFGHESIFDLVLGRSDPASHFSYQTDLLESVYFGVTRGLRDRLPREDLAWIGRTVQGKGPLGPLLNGTMDLDNIDNVFRLGYHMGITRPEGTPEILAHALRINAGELGLERNLHERVEHWYEARSRLYGFLLLNADEMAATCMLREASEIASARSSLEFRWQDVDFRVAEKLFEAGSESRTIVQRLMHGDLYGCVTIAMVPSADDYARIRDPDARGGAEDRLAEALRASGIASLKKASVALHAIADRGRSTRQVRYRTASGRVHSVGSSADRLIVGVFLRNTTLSASKVVRRAANEWPAVGVALRALEDVFGPGRLSELEPYAELA